MSQLARLGQHRAILVGNKSDLARTRRVQAKVAPYIHSVDNRASNEGYVKAREDFTITDKVS